MGVGLVQGSILSPILFNVYINNLPKTLRERRSGLNINGLEINSLLYADDIVLVTNSSQQLQKMLRTCERHSRENKYEFAPEKCEVVPPVYRKDTQTPVSCTEKPSRKLTGTCTWDYHLERKDSTQEGCAR